MRHLRFKKTLIAISIGVLIAAALAYRFWPASLDTRFNGAYRLEDGRLVFVTARDADTKSLRFVTMDGESRALWPTRGNRFTAGPGWNARNPTELVVTFETTAGGKPAGLLWQAKRRAPLHGRRIVLPERKFPIVSGDLRLRARLVLPVGRGPFPAVVIAQGSEGDSAVDTYYEPYLFAAHGIASLVYDKRGTGGSQGTYTENFRLLAHDLSTAIDWLRREPEIDPSRISLSGYSQGGWVAPLAARENGHVRGLLINYGPAVPVIDEDRWGYVFSLRQAGFGQDVIARVDQINANASAIIDRNENRWSELAAQLNKAKNEPWFSALKRSDSGLGYLLSSGMPLWVMHIYEWWLFHRDPAGPYIDRLYDPVPTVAALKQAPSLWIFGGHDHSMPTQWSVEKLQRLRAEGRPISILIFRDADHGVLRVLRTKSGDETILGFEPGYFATQVNWLRANSGLPPLSESEQGRSR